MLRCTRIDGSRLLAIMSFGAPKWFWALPVLPLLVGFYIRAERRSAINCANLFRRDCCRNSLVMSIAAARDSFCFRFACARARDYRIGETALGLHLRRRKTSRARFAFRGRYIAQHAIERCGAQST